MRKYVLALQKKASLSKTIPLMALGFDTRRDIIFYISYVLLRTSYVHMDRVFSTALTKTYQLKNTKKMTNVL